MTASVYRQHYDKLVRDKIPGILGQQGKKYRCHMVIGDELRDALREKVLEEIGEYMSNPCLEELADVYEALEAAVKAEGYTLTDIKEYRIKKCQTNGAFNQGTILEYIEE